MTKIRIKMKKMMMRMTGWFPTVTSPMMREYQMKRSVMLLKIDLLTIQFEVDLSGYQGGPCGRAVKSAVS